MSLSDMFLPQHQNTTQRAGVVVTLIAMVLLVFLHNPLDGYRIDESKNRYKEYINPTCSKEEVEEGKRLYLQSEWPLSKWGDVANFDPLPDGFDTWPMMKQVNWKLTFKVKANKIFEKCVKIYSDPYDETLPFFEWSSNSPLVNWLGSLIHLLSALFAIAVSGVIWVSVFQKKPTEGSQS